MLPTPPTTPLRHWVPGGGAPTAAHLNEPVDWINNFRIATGMTGAGVPPLKSRLLIGRIVDAGPNGEDDLGTATPKYNYWVAEQWIAGGSNSLDYTYSDGVDSENEDYIHRVTNIAEVPSDTHLLKIDQPVMFWAEEDGGDEPEIRFVMNVPVPQMFVVDLTQTGGAAGSDGVLPTWTYTVKHQGGTVELLTNAAPAVRLIAVEHSAATVGLAYVTPSGLALLQAFETPTGGTACP